MLFLMEALLCSLWGANIICN